MFAFNGTALGQTLDVIFGSPQNPDVVNSFQLTLSDPTGNEFGRGGCVSDGYGSGSCENDYTITVWEGVNTYYSGTSNMPFNWNGVLTPTLNQTQLTPPNNSSFNVTVTDSWSGLGPWTCTNCFQTSNGLSVAEGTLINLQVYPNPVADVVNITSDVALDEAVVYTVDGALVKTYSQNLRSIDVSALKSGMYVLIVRSEDSQYRSSFVKE